MYRSFRSVLIRDSVFCGDSSGTNCSGIVWSAQFVMWADWYRSGTGMDAHSSVPIQTVPEQFVPVQYHSRCGEGISKVSKVFSDQICMTYFHRIMLMNFLVDMQHAYLQRITICHYVITHFWLPWNWCKIFLKFWVNVPWVDLYQVCWNWDATPFLNRIWGNFGQFLKDLFIWNNWSKIIYFIMILIFHQEFVI